MKTRIFVTAAALLTLGLTFDFTICSLAQAQRPDRPRGRDQAGQQGQRDNRAREGRSGRAGGMRASLARGMFRGGDGDPIGSLLHSADVREELGLEPEQAEALKKIQQRFREEARSTNRRSLRDFDFRNASQDERAEFFSKMQADQKEQAEKHRELLEEVLLPDQMQRLDELALQRRGMFALADSEIQQAIGLSEEQLEQLQQVRSEQETAMREKMRELFQSGDRSGMREKMTAAREQMEQAVLGVLSPDQQSKFQEMKGEPFEFEENSGRFRRRADRSSRRGKRGE